MTEILKLIQERHSSRVPFDSRRPVSAGTLRQILEAGRWAPTAHNMQNFEIVVIDDPGLLDRIGNIESKVSEMFLRENYQQLSFSEEELRQKKVGLLATSFPASWRTPGELENVARESVPPVLHHTMQGAPVVLVVLHDSRRRAPASEGDVLGQLSLGCVMENMWLMAQSLGVGFQIMTVFSGLGVKSQVKDLLGVPERMKISFAVRLGYPASPPSGMLRVRRDVDDLTHHNRFGRKGLGG
jgi:nitroreductase